MRGMEHALYIDIDSSCGMVGFPHIDISSSGVLAPHVRPHFPSCDVVVLVTLRSRRIW